MISCVDRLVGMIQQKKYSINLTIFYNITQGWFQKENKSNLLFVCSLFDWSLGVETHLNPNKN